MVYKTYLSPAEETSFQDWYKRYSAIRGLDPNPDHPEHHYDIRGYWKNNPSYEALMPFSHLPDTWKTPGHSTFSVESIYSTPENPGGYWNGDDFVSNDDEDLINFTKSYETFKSTPYILNGQTLIGYGSADPELIAKGQITEKEADTHVRKKYRQLRSIAEKNIPNWFKLAKGTQRALLETMYNAGSNKVLKGSPNLMKLLSEGITDPNILVKEMDHSKTAGGWLGVRSAARRAMALGKYDWNWDTVDKYGRQVDYSQYKGPKDYKSSPYYMKYQSGGLIYDPFVAKSLTNKSNTEEIDITDFLTDSSEIADFPVEPVKTWTWNGDLSTYEKPVYNQTVTKGVTEFKNESIDVGNMRELLDKFEEAGISVRVTSGVENRKTKSGKTSKHAVADAIDITPIKGQTYADLKEQIMNSPELLAYMRENGIGIIDETDPLIKMKTGATGDHWHISRNENFALYGFNKMFGKS